MLQRIEKVSKFITRSISMSLESDSGKPCHWYSETFAKPRFLSRDTKLLFV